MFIQTEATPNPSTLKFLPGRTVMAHGTADFKASGEAGASPLATRIFAVEGVNGVFFGPDFISVAKDEVDWAHIKPAILGAIMEHYTSGEPIMLADESHESGHAVHDGPDSEIVAQMGIVYLSMRGACAGCPSATMTLKMGIENLLRHYIPDVLEVRPVGV